MCLKKLQKYDEISSTFVLILLLTYSSKFSKNKFLCVSFIRKNLSLIAFVTWRLYLSVYIFRETKWKNQLENFIGEYRKHDVSKYIRNEKESSDTRPYLDGVLLKQKQPQL